MVTIISKSEYESTFQAINKSLTSKVEEIELTDKIPTIDETQDNNKVFRGKLSILFVDMRNSTDLTDELKSKKMAKIYRAFSRMIIQAVRYSGGEVRQFAGDGVMGVFRDDYNDTKNVTSSEKAINAARYIITMLDYCLNPQLLKSMGLSIGCGVGVATGTVLVTKVGMRGKERDESKENEMSLVWTGQTTNYASRFCSLAKSGEIFIDSNTHKEIEKDENWQECQRLKSSKVFTGFVSKDYYLEFMEDLEITPVKALYVEEKEDAAQVVFDDIKLRGKSFVQEFLTECANLTVKETDLIKREQELAKREQRLKATLLEAEADLLSDTLLELCDNFSEEQIMELGKDFFLERIEKLKNLYRKLNIFEFYAYEARRFFRIYEQFNVYFKAYEMLCIMAKNEYCITKNEIEFVQNHWDTKELKELLLAYYYRNENSLADRYGELAEILED